MYIIHTADFHLESPLSAGLESKKAQERKKELVQNFSRLAEYAKLNNVSKIILAGDIFDDAKISARTKNFFLETIKEYPEIDFFYIYGSKEEGTVLQGDILPDNLKLFGNDFKTYHYDDCDITGIDYQEKYDFNGLIINPTHKNIVILHGDIMDNIKLNELKGRGIDYLALGHVHKWSRGRIDERGNYAYPGTIEGNGFDESGEKGFLKIDTTGKMNPEFIPFAKRRLYEIEMDITGMENYNDIRRNLDIKLSDIRDDDLISVKLTGYYTIDMIKQNEILEELLNERFYYAKITDETSLKVNPKDYENDISLKGEFIRNVMASDLSEEEKNRVIEYGIRALLKEGI